MATSSFIPDSFIPDEESSAPKSFVPDAPTGEHFISALPKPGLLNRVKGIVMGDVWSGETLASRLLSPVPSDPTLAAIDKNRSPLAQTPALRPEALSPERGPQRAVLQVAGSLTSPENALIVGTVAKISRIPEVGAAMARAASGAFSAQMLESALSSDPEWNDARKGGDFSVMSEIATRKALELVLGGMAGRHAISGRPVPVVERPQTPAVKELPPVPGTAEAVRAVEPAPTPRSFIPDAQPAPEPPLKPSAPGTIPPAPAIEPARPVEPVVEPVAAAEPRRVTPDVLPKGSVPLDDGTVLVPTEEIHADPVRFQFKTKGIGQKGVTSELKNVQKWDVVSGGILAVWKDPADGKTYVSSGHHRHDLAVRLNVPQVRVSYVDAANATEARGIGALLNMKDGRGDAVDAAKVLRDLNISDEKLAEYGVSLTGPVAAEALPLRDLTPEVFSKVASGDLDKGVGAAIGRMLKTPEDQIAVLDQIMAAEESGKKITEGLVERFINISRRAYKETSITDVSKGGQVNLFGEAEITRNYAMEEAQLADWVAKQIRQEKRLFGAVGTEEAAGRLGKSGNVIKAEENARIAEEAAGANQLFEALYDKSGPVADALQKGAMDLAHGGKPSDVRKATYLAVRTAIGEALRGQRRPSPAGVQEAGVAGRDAGQPGGILPSEPARQAPEQPGLGFLSSERGEATIPFPPKPPERPLTPGEQYVQERVAMRETARAAGKPTTKQSAADWITTHWAEVRKKFVDSNAPILDVTKWAYEQAGLKISPLKSVEYQLDRAILADSISEQFAAPLKEIIKKVDNVNNLEEYLTAVHAQDMVKAHRSAKESWEEAYTRIFGEFRDPAKDAALIEEFSPRYAEAGQQFKVINNALLDRITESAEPYSLARWTDHRTGERKIKVQVPYRASFVEEAKALNGRFNEGHDAWYFDGGKEAEIKAALEKEYGPASEFNVDAGAGLISKDLADYLKRTYPNYSPLNRILPELLDQPAGFGKGGAVASLGRQTAVLKLEGAELPVESPLASLLEKIPRVFREMERNKAARMVADLRNIPGAEGIIREAAPGQDVNPRTSFSALINGKRRAFITSPEIAAAAKSLDPVQIGGIGRMANVAVRLAKTFITGVNPGFLLSNIPADIQSTFLIGEHGMKASLDPKTYVRAFMASVGHDKLYEEMVSNGTINFATAVRAPAHAQVSKLHALTTPEGKLDYYAKHPLEAAGDIFRKIEDTVARSEEFGRARMYSATKEAKMAEGVPEREAEILATLQANTAMPPFHRAGDWGRAANGFWLYFNASLQGSRSFVRAAAERPLATALRASIWMTPMALATLWNVSDPDRKKAYADVQEYEKDGNFILIPSNPQQDEKNRWIVFKMKLTQGHNYLARPIRRVIEAWSDMDPVSLGEIARDLVSGVSPVALSGGQAASQAIPQIMKPPIQATANYDFFKGQPKIPQGMKNRPVEMQAFPWTSATAKVVARRLGLPPITVEEYFKDTIGGMGSQILGVSDMALATAGIISPEDMPEGGFAGQAREISRLVTGRFAEARGGATASEAAQKELRATRTAIDASAKEISKPVFRELIRLKIGYGPSARHEYNLEENAPPEAETDGEYLLRMRLTAKLIDYTVKQTMEDTDEQGKKYWHTAPKTEEYEDARRESLRTAIRTARSKITGLVKRLEEEGTDASARLAVFQGLIKMTPEEILEIDE